MAIDVGLIRLSYFEADANNCFCETDDSGSGVVVTGPVPGPVEEADLEDIYFDVAAATGPDYSVTAAGDWLPVVMDEALRQSLLRRFITNPGEWQTKPEYGAGGRAFLKAKSTKASRDAFAQRLRAQAILDIRVASVISVDIERFTDGGWKYHVRIQRRGREKTPENAILVTMGPEV